MGTTRQTFERILAGCRVLARAPCRRPKGLIRGATREVGTAEMVVSSALARSTTGVYFAGGDRSSVRPDRMRVSIDLAPPQPGTLAASHARPRQCARERFGAILRSGRFAGAQSADTLSVLGALTGKVFVRLAVVIACRATGFELTHAMVEGILDSDGALEEGANVDQPRNLAKSVTVE